MTFIGQLELRYLRETGKWELLCPFSYITKDAETIVVPVGFQTDGASIPRFFWRTIGSPMTGKYIFASVIHDYLCFLAHQNQYSRKRADSLFSQMLAESKVFWLKRKVMYLGVRLASFF